MSQKNELNEAIDKMIIKYQSDQDDAIALTDWHYYQGMIDGLRSAQVALKNLCCDSF